MADARTLISTRVYYFCILCRQLKSCFGWLVIINEVNMQIESTETGEKENVPFSTKTHPESLALHVCLVFVRHSSRIQLISFSLPLKSISRSPSLFFQLIFFVTRVFLFFFHLST